LKYIKLYEKKATPKVDDYVLLHYNFDNACELYKTTHNVSLKDITNYINNTIGQIYKIDDSSYPYFIKYENIPNNLKFWFGKENNFFFRVDNQSHITCFSSDEEELERILLSKVSQKYNL